MAIGPISNRWSTLKLLDTMKWAPLEQLLERATISMTHDIIHLNEPMVLSFKILNHGLILMNKGKIVSNKITRLTGPGTKPKDVGRTKLTRYHFRANSYRIYGTLPKSITDIKSKKRFLSWVKKYQKNKN